MVFLTLPSGTVISRTRPKPFADVSARVEPSMAGKVMDGEIA